MKIVATRTLRLGRRISEGEEFELPDKVAQRFVKVGYATEAKAKAAKKKAEPEPENEKKTYKTRHLKAEDK